jgi:hypothetical protein
MTSTVTCPHCDGDRGFESRPYGYNHHDGSPLTHWTDCKTCKASGTVNAVEEVARLREALHAINGVILTHEQANQQGQLLDPQDLLSITELVREALGYPRGL